MWKKTRCMVRMSIQPFTKILKIHGPRVRNSEPRMGSICPYRKHVLNLEFKKKTSSVLPYEFEKNIQVIAWF